MRLVVQRVKKSKVEVSSQVVGAIEQGILVFLGVRKGDSVKEADYLVEKLCQLRMFEDSDGKMNLSALEIKAQVLVVSQFTLYGDCKKGRRPSFDQAADPDLANELYEYFVKRIGNQGLIVQTGQFRATMDVSLINDGPVTFILESL